MTREEEIKIASVDNADKRQREINTLDYAISAKPDYYNGLAQGFKDGAKWADKTMIEKFRKILKEQYFRVSSNGYYERVLDDDEIEELIKTIME